MFPVLPTAGLDRLLHLKTFNNPRLREFPPPESFPRVQTLVLSYAYHCCVFLPLVAAEPPRMPLRESVLFPTDNEFDMSLWNGSLTDIWPQLRKCFCLSIKVLKVACTSSCKIKFYVLLD